MDSSRCIGFKVAQTILVNPSISSESEAIGIFFLVITPFFPSIPGLFDVEDDSTIPESDRTVRSNILD